MVARGIKAMSSKASVILDATPRRQLAWVPATRPVNRSPRNSFTVLPPFRLARAHDEVA
jgi:hypothetical protein